MANCHQEFTDFDVLIDLNDSRIKSLKKSRKSLRDRIRNHFNENHKDEIKPKFWSQGSFQMGTAVNPIGREVVEAGNKIILFRYDVDDGIYFIGSLPQRKSVATYHDWIYDAVKGHTDKDPIDKNTCVRTIFSDGHHIDQPIYFEVERSVPELAHKAKDWTPSDPRQFTDWFEQKANNQPQLKRLVRFFKAWCDYQNFKDDSRKMPSGLVMTIWTAENASYNGRDDIAMKETLANIKTMIDTQSTLSCNRPTVPAGENLLSDYKHTDYFKEKLNAFEQAAKQAINETNPKRACGKWQQHFGDRFSCSTARDIEENAATFSGPAVISGSAKSAR